MRAAFSFLTLLGGARAPSAGALRWFPVVGAGLGLVLGGCWWVAERVWGAPVAAALVVAADLALTGLLHVDGLADSADGLLPHLERPRRLEVMAEPGVGAFGAAVVGAVVLLRFASLASLRPGVLLLGALWCLSRTSMGVVVLTQPYARPGGLASAFGGAPRAGELGRAVAEGWPLAGGLALSVAMAVAWRPLAGGLSAAAAAASCAGVVVLARRRLGGYTGDVLGAAGIVAETTGLVVAAARW